MSSGTSATRVLDVRRYARAVIRRQASRGRLVEEDYALDPSV
jgi:hypothetical protein